MCIRDRYSIVHHTRRVTVHVLGRPRAPVESFGMDATEPPPTVHVFGLFKLSLIHISEPTRLDVI
eukprot:2147753-Prorocentrum_lima.AAC.1